MVGTYLEKQEAEEKERLSAKNNYEDVLLRKRA
jgi:hypothetical protein